VSGARRRAIVALLVLVAIGPLLALAPFAPGAVRLAGISLLWWYTGLVAPLAAITIVVTTLWRRAG
jgi:hypothetical protein